MEGNRGKGSAGDWKACLAAWGLTEESALEFRGLPIDHLEPLAKAGVPILNVVGEADLVVPVAENSDILDRMNVSVPVRKRLDQCLFALDGFKVNVFVIHTQGLSM